MCEECIYLEYHEELREYVCSIENIMDEDDMARLTYSRHKHCPYYKIGDEYSLVRKQN